MNTVIGLWIIALALTLMLTGLDPNLTFKTGVKIVVGIMTVVTLIFVGSYFIAGGAK